MDEALRSKIDRLADRLGASPEARKKWWQRGHVPARWRYPLIQAAESEGVALSWELLGDLNQLKQQQAA